MLPTTLIKPDGAADGAPGSGTLGWVLRVAEIATKPRSRARVAMLREAVLSTFARELSPLKRPVNLYLEWDLDYPVDFICYTPEEFKKLSRRPSLVRGALKEGKVVEFGSASPR